MVSSQGIEPRLRAPKARVRPLDDKEMKIRRLQHQERKKGIKIGGHFDYTTTKLHWKCPNFARIQRSTRVRVKNDKIPYQHKNARQNALYCVILEIKVVRKNVVDK